MGEVYTQVGRCMRAGVLLLVGCSDYAFTTELAENLPGEPPTPLEAGFGPQDAELTTPYDCDDWEGWEPYGVTIDETCMGEPAVPDMLEATIKWQWSDSEEFPGFDRVMAAPAVGNLTDDNGDGLVNDLDVPDIVFTAFDSNDYNLDGTLTVLSGDTGEVIWSLIVPNEEGDVQFSSTGGVAIGDLEGDGSPDICVSGYRIAIICMEADGRFKWAAGDEYSQSGAPAIADMDGDGTGEVVYGRQVFTHDGDLMGIGDHGKGGVDPNSVTSFALDWDDDGYLDVIAGNAIYNRFGETILQTDGVDGYPAVADLDMDGRPDLAVVAQGSVEVFNNDGEWLWSGYIVGEGDGGPPTIADFDGDGLPEIGVAGEGSYSVFDGGGELLWVHESTDVSSGITGSAVFDFEGDGIAEVLYADEYTMGVYDGRDGTVRLEFEEHASGTLVEYPMVVDVDNDGVTEIVVVSNDYSRDGWTGITVLENINNAWAPARPIWNQHAFFTTNIDDDGQVPEAQDPHWEYRNDFRAGGYGEPALGWMPDLHPGEPRSCLDDCDLGTIRMSIPVENGGMLGAGGFGVSLVREDGSDVAQLSSPRLLEQGASQILDFDIDEETWGEGELFIRLDRWDFIDECDETDNRLSLGFWPCDDYVEGQD